MGSYEKAKGRSKQSFVMVRHDMMASEAWCSLSCKSRCVWLEIMRRYNGYNNGRISLSCREAALLCNISKNTASRCFIELQDKGFIRIGSYGGFRNKYRYASRWEVTHEKFDDQGPTNEWRKWKPNSNYGTK